MQLYNNAYHTRMLHASISCKKRPYNNNIEITHVVQLPTIKRLASLQCNTYCSVLLANLCLSLAHIRIQSTSAGCVAAATENARRAACVLCFVLLSSLVAPSITLHLAIYYRYNNNNDNNDVEDADIWQLLAAVDRQFVCYDAVHPSSCVYIYIYMCVCVCVCVCV